MSKKTYAALFVFVLLAGLILAGCATQATPETIIETVEVEKVVTEEVTVIETVEVPVEVTPVVEEDTTALPRDETMYFNGLQWGPVVCWNP
ncbi:MAG: hypothetical protein ACWGOY_15945, partial [Anaerolineales bacterium]